MIRDLATILGPGQRRPLRAYLAWLVAYSVLQGVAMALLVPLLRALLAGDRAAAPAWLGWLAAAVLVFSVARYQQSMRGFTLALTTLETLHDRLGDHIATLPLGWFTPDKVGRLARSATGGTMMVTNVTAHFLTPVVSGVLTPATIAVAMLWFDWRLGLAVLATAPLILLGQRWSAAAVGRGEERTDAAGSAAASRVVEFAKNQPVLRAFGRTTEGYAPLDAAIERQRTAAGSLLRATMPRLMAGGLTVHLAFAVVVGVGVVLAVEGALDPVTAVALIALSARFVGPLAEAAGRSGMLRMAANDLRRLAAVFAERPLPEPATSKQPTEPGAVEFRDVTFGYTDTPVLRGLSLRIAPRTMTAVVGASGSGKTTMTRLITRFFDVDAGAVHVGGVDVREQSTADLMAQISLVPQDVYLFDDTLEANIRVGRPEATDAEVREAARLAGVTEIVTRLPGGWDTRVGEGGTSLSGGERQRVALARAIVKAAPVVVLDEATAALDTENEGYVRDAMRVLMERSTLIVIAHRLPTVVAADQIVVLDGGRVAETGTHEQLLAAGGRYHAFWTERSRARGWRLVGSG